MSRPAAADTLPPSARALALLVAATPGVHDAQPGVLHQLLELAHRYAGQVLQDAQVYAEHAGRGGRVDMPDVALAVQARVGWEFGGRVPKDVRVPARVCPADRKLTPRSISTRSQRRRTACRCLLCPRCSACDSRRRPSA
jgi:hypothetical protein